MLQVCVKFQLILLNAENWRGWRYVFFFKVTGKKTNKTKHKKTTFTSQLMSTFSVLLDQISQWNYVYSFFFFFLLNSSQSCGSEVLLSKSASPQTSGQWRTGRAIFASLFKHLFVRVIQWLWNLSSWENIKIGTVVYVVYLNLNSRTLLVLLGYVLAGTCASPLKHRRP